MDTGAPEKLEQPFPGRMVDLLMRIGIRVNTKEPHPLLPSKRHLGWGVLFFELPGMAIGSNHHRTLRGPFGYAQGRPRRRMQQSLQPFLINTL